MKLDAAALRAAILAADDRPLMGPIMVPEWGVSVWMREMTGAERFAQSMRFDEQREAGVDPGAVLLAHVLVDEQGARIFSDDDAQALGAKNSAVLVRLMQQMNRMSALGEEGVEAAKKPSEPTPG